jgi:hypothetical protein
MSSFATAEARTPDKEPSNGKQLHLLVNPDDAPEAQAPSRAEAPLNNPPNLDEINRVERLLSNLEARSMALVPYGYGTLREIAPQKSNTALIAGVIVAIWLTTMVLAVSYMRYIGHSPFSSDRAPAAPPPMVIAPDADSQDRKVAASVDHLAEALVSSSQRMNQLQEAVEKSNRDLRQIATKVNIEHADLPSTADATNQTAESTAAVSSPGVTLPKNWHKVLDVKPTESAIAHKGVDGKTDYWLVPRGADIPAAKVLPIGISANGVVVHNLDDGKDYTVTPAGDWLNGSLSSGN